MTTVDEHRYEVRALDDIRPYWRNPRQIPEEAVNAVMDSIRRYGYRNPIIVNDEGVILTGHTRYAALRKLGAERVTVQVADLTPEKAREYRVMDNRAGEFSTWDRASLVMELREFSDMDLLADYFPEVDLEIDSEVFEKITNEDVEQASDDLTAAADARHTETVSITCPSCYHTFDVKADTL